MKNNAIYVKFKTKAKIWVTKLRQRIKLEDTTGTHAAELSNFQAMVRVLPDKEDENCSATIISVLDLPEGSEDSHPAVFSEHFFK